MPGGTGGGGLKALDRRALLGLLVGLAGMAAAVLGALFEWTSVQILGGLAALAASAMVLSLVRQLTDAEADRDRLTAALAELDPSAAPATALLDTETGLPDEWFFHVVLEGRVAVARRQLHALTVVLVEVGMETAGHASAAPMNEFVGLLRGTLRDADIACRTGPTSFSVILERTPEEGGIWVAERVQLAVVKHALPVQRIAAAVATYPTHGASGDEVLTRARRALARAIAAPHGPGLSQIEIASL